MQQEWVEYYGYIVIYLMAHDWVVLSRIVGPHTWSLLPLLLQESEIELTHDNCVIYAT